MKHKCINNVSVIVSSPAEMKLVVMNEELDVVWGSWFSLVLHKSTNGTISVSLHAECKVMLDIVLLVK